MKNILEASYDEIFDVGYWKELVPFLTVCGEKRGKETKRKKKTVNRFLKPEDLRAHKYTECGAIREKLVEDGYCVISNKAQVTELLFDEPSGPSFPEETARQPGKAVSNITSEKYFKLIAALRKAVLVLDQAGWPATFLAVYDEVWELAELYQQFMLKLTSNRNVFAYDIVGFYTKCGTGFSPHRDRQPEDWQPKGHAPEDPRTTFDAETKLAKYLTAWIGLSDATPENSCLHYVSAKADPGYWDGDDGECDADATVNGKNDPMSKVFFNKNHSFQDIRAAAVRSGGFNLHTHRVIHWGSKGDAHVVIVYSTLGLADSPGWVTVAGSMAI
ncbi:hypothetical protein CYMTET_13827 [Cymbomonas tetramitiformis]|uniref:Uncharacterized protein n=1 Tax=Cymbomonas tetramitiformis TaxID=36881 RepID=A0AAE0GHK0_9CHLO|nr:hypothetical protein CYMTET_13827 [Cymbomonas tetramitiformis]